MKRPFLTLATLIAACLSLSVAPPGEASFASEDVLQVPIAASAGFRSYVRLALDANDRPHIVFDVEGRTLYYATRGESGGWSIERVDSLVRSYAPCGLELGFGTLCDITVGADGVARVVYYDPCLYQWGEKIRFKRRGPLTAQGQWSTWRDSVVTDARPTGPLSMAIGADGGIHVAYKHTNPDAVRYVRWNEGQRTTIPETVAATSYGDPSLLLDGSGGPLVAYNNAGDVWLAAKSAAAWGSTLAAAGGNSLAQSDPSLAMAPNGDLKVAYSLSDLNLGFTSRTGGAWIPDPAGSVAGGGTAPRIAVGPGGVPRILHVDGQKHLILTSPRGAIWESESLPEDTIPDDVDSHDLAIDSRGRAHVVWQVLAGNPTPSLQLRYAIQGEPTVGVTDTRSVQGRIARMSARPDPVRQGSEFAVGLSGWPAGAATIRMIDVTGREVSRREVEVSAEGHGAANWTIPQVGPGVYFLVARAGATESRRRLIVLP